MKRTVWFGSIACLVTSLAFGDEAPVSRTWRVTGNAATPGSQQVYGQQSQAAQAIAQTQQQRAFKKQQKKLAKKAKKAVPAGTYVLRGKGAKNQKVVLKVIPIKKYKGHLHPRVRANNTTVVVLKRKTTEEKNGAGIQSTTINHFVTTFQSRSGELNLALAQENAHPFRQFPDQILQAVQTANPQLVSQHGDVTACQSVSYAFEASTKILTIKLTLTDAPDKPMHFDFYKKDVKNKVKFRRISRRVSMAVRGRQQA